MTIGLMQALNMRQNPLEYKTNKAGVDSTIDSAIKNIQFPSKSLPKEFEQVLELRNGKVSKSHVEAEERKLLSKFNTQECQRIAVNIKIRNYREKYIHFPNDPHNAEMVQSIKEELTQVVKKADDAEASKATSSKYKTAAKIVGGLALLMLAVAAVAVTLIFAAPIVAVPTLIIIAAVAGAGAGGFTLTSIHLIQKATAYNRLADTVGGAEEARQFLNEIRPFGVV